MVRNIQKLNHWKSEQNGGGRGQFDQNRIPLKNQTEGYHWNSERVWYFSPTVDVFGWPIIG